MSHKVEVPARAETARLQYGTPTLTRYGSVRNLTGGSCGFDEDTFLGTGDTPGNFNMFGC